jgi:hypothetical protein
MKPILIILICLFIALPTRAQIDQPTSDTIQYNQLIMNSISEEAIYDWWFIQAQAGDVMLIEMQGENGLEPLIGLMNENFELITQSQNGPVDGTVSVLYTVENSGEYVIVATRAGNLDGQSTGDYRLLVSKQNITVPRENPYQQVTFRCGNFEVTTAATLALSEDIGQGSTFRVSVYGLDGFVPAIRFYDREQDFSDCSSDPQSMGGNTYTLPGEETVTYTGEDDTLKAAHLAILGIPDLSNVTLTIGSRDNTTGRYIALIEGFRIDPADDLDYINIGQGPLAASRPLTVYMLADPSERLDPAMSFFNTPSAGITCDDAGRRDCPDIPSIAGFHSVIALDGKEITGSRFDAGAILSPAAGTPQLYLLELSSFSGRTSGNYSLLLFGEIPENIAAD